MTSMSTGIDKLLDLLIDAGKDLLPWYIIDAYEKSVVLRLGRLLRDPVSGETRVYGPGIHFKLPFLDDPLLVNVATETLDGKLQSLTTLDGKAVVVSAICKHHVSDPKIYLIDVRDVRDALESHLMGCTRLEIRSRTWDACQLPDLDYKITLRLRKEAARWGIEVEAVTVVDLSLMRSIRLAINPTTEYKIGK
jgi:regulator of protease activity HflC (stomatin/prohibitin superfamily)